MKLLIKWIISALGILLAAYLIPDFYVSGFYIAFIVALLLGLINISLKPLFVLLTLPINILTLGLFTFIIDGFFFWLLSTFIEGFAINGFWAAILGALVASVFNWLGFKLVSQKH